MQTAYDYHAHYQTLIDKMIIKHQDTSTGRDHCFRMREGVKTPGQDASCLLGMMISLGLISLLLYDYI